MASMRLESFTASKHKIKPTKSKAITPCTFFLTASGRVNLRSTSRMSTQKLVVKAVSAESALLNAAAIIPIVNSTNTPFPKWPSAQNKGKMSSPFTGKSIPSRDAKANSRTPTPRNSIFKGMNEKPYEHMSFCASCRFLHVRFFCIIS